MAEITINDKKVLIITSGVYNWFLGPGSAVNGL